MGNVKGGDIIQYSGMSPVMVAVMGAAILGAVWFYNKPETPVHPLPPVASPPIVHPPGDEVIITPLPGE